eukprot:SAG11_NODE_1165_length_5621_cov_7.341543_5_plen_249_part_00
MLLSLEVHRFPFGERPRPALSMRAVQVLAQSMLHCLEQLDEFLGSSPHFLLGKWLADARASATSESEAVLFEFGARNQLMMWGASPEVGPNPDYACKHWCAWELLPRSADLPSARASDTVLAIFYWCWSALAITGVSAGTAWSGATTVLGGLFFCKWWSTNQWSRVALCHLRAASQVSSTPLPGASAMRQTTRATRRMLPVERAPSSYLSSFLINSMTRVVSPWPSTPNTSAKTTWRPPLTSTWATRS